MKNVKRLMKEGRSKTEVFTAAFEKGLNPKKVSKYLAMFPDAEEARKYNKANNILIAIYSIVVLLGLFGTVPMLIGLPSAAIIGVLAVALLIPGAVIFSIYKKQSIGYLILCLFMLKGILDSLGVYAVNPVGVWVNVSINASLLVYAVILKNKLFPHQNFLNTRKNEEGLSVYTKAVAG